MAQKLWIAALSALALSACASSGASSPEEPTRVERVTNGVNSAADRVGRSVDAAAGGVERTFESFEKPEDQLVADPFEPFNRAVFAFNDGLDRALLGPVSTAYRTVVPRPGRERVRDFVDNLKTPIWFANEALQGDWDGARDQAARFGLNSTVGVLGVYDFAANELGIAKHDEDFGQTLAVWGVGNGPYLMLPLLGPSTLRDTAGRVVDYGLDPLTYARWQNRDEVAWGLRTADVVDIRTRTEDAVAIIRESADPYVQTRAIYLQARNQRIAELELSDDAGAVDQELDRYAD